MIKASVVIRDSRCDQGHKSLLSLGLFSIVLFHPFLFGSGPLHSFIHILGIHYLQ